MSRVDSRIARLLRDASEKAVIFPFGVRRELAEILVTWGFLEARRSYIPSAGFAITPSGRSALEEYEGPGVSGDQ